MSRIAIFLLLLPFASLEVLLAQDTRTVLEPQMPASCTTLKAQLIAAEGSLSEANEDHPDTARIQAAIDKCPIGQGVRLISDGRHNAFLSGPLKLRQGISLLIDRGVTLFASRNPRDYDITSGACGKTDDNGHGCKPLIQVIGADAAIMGDGVIDGRGGAKLIGQNKSWWDLAQDAKRENNKQNCPRLVIADKADNFILYRITLRNSPNFHVMVSRTNGFTAWGVKIDSPENARNTDGIDPSGSKNVTITHSYIRAGDDNVAIKAGGAGATTNVTIAHNHFYYGHGMSIGSETFAGVSQILVSDLTMEGTTSGLRIKSDSNRGGLVENVVYENVCIRDVKNPIAMDPYYEHNMAKGERVPVYHNIQLRGVHSLTPGKITLIGTDAQHSLSVQFDGVIIENQKAEDVQTQYGLFLIGPGATNLSPAGIGVEKKEVPGKAMPVPECKQSFVPFPLIP